MTTRTFATLCMMFVACEPIEHTIAISVFPAEGVAMRASGADNVTLALAPDGDVLQASTTGLTVPISVDLGAHPSASRTLTLYFARGENPLAFGQTPAFSPAVWTGGQLSVLVSLPGEPVAMPRFGFEVLGGQLVALRDGGLVFVHDEGQAHTLNQLTYTAEQVDDIPRTQGAPLLVAVENRAVLLDFGPTPTAFALARETGAWEILAWQGATEQLVQRKGPLHVTTDNGITLVGGGAFTNVIALRPAASGEPAFEVTVMEGALDTPRPRAALVDLGESLLVIGGNDNTPLLWHIGAQEGGGENDAWQDPICATLSATPPAIVCAGGTTARVAGNELLQLTLPSATSPAMLETTVRTGWADPAASFTFIPDGASLRVWAGGELFDVPTRAGDPLTLAHPLGLSAPETPAVRDHAGFLWWIATTQTGPTLSVHAPNLVRAAEPPV